jgi:uncharacterized damage-inducible protein DinB
MSDAIAERQALPTIFEWQAKAVEDAARNVAFWVSTTPEDKLSWEPKAEGEDSKSRSIYSQIHECTQVNRRFANLLNGGTNGPWDPEPHYANSAEAEADLKASATELAAAIRGLDEEAFAKEYTTGMGQMSCAAILSLTVNNMYYHGGQINQIQLLLGDEEFRFPPVE